jgi:class 3 adenylate cyclase/putative methionine-R-sulfoxide reductase with GAF domain
MKRRSRAGGQPDKPPRRKRSTPKHRNASKVVRNRGVSVAGQETVVGRLTHERDEALLRETANFEILRLLSKSPGNLELVFRSILENATRICEAKFGLLFRFDGETFQLIAEVGASAELAEFYERRGPFHPGGILERLLRTKDVVCVADASAEPVPPPSAKIGGAKSSLNVPMFKDEAMVGAITIYRQEIRPFTDRQIALLENFAAQAVIAIENTRLLNELRQSLEQQTATSEVLSVISSSPGELEPVFQTMLQNATRICEAKFGFLWLAERDGFRAVAFHNVPPALAAGRRHDQIIHFGPETPMGRLVETRQLVHVADIRSEPAYVEGFRPLRELADIGGGRTLLTVPMLKENEVVGAFAIYRQEVRPFTDKHIALIQNFAAQAVIAIENTRLLDDLNKLNQQLEQRVSDQVGEIERMSRLRRFLPQQVADLIVASGTEKQLESHRREITALFCDLRGFTGFSESSDPEDVMALLRDYHAAIGEIIIKYSGTLERYAGDGVMVVFNDPVPVENPALQAVLMALEMRDAIGALTETWHRWGHDIGFGIGIAHGFATLGTIGFEGRFDYAAIGTVSNVASRLCDEAKPGQILISPRVLTKVENAVTVEPVGEFTLKGIRRPMMAYNVLAASASKLN